MYRTEGLIAINFHQANDNKNLGHKTETLNV